jgi:hypothetical protein
MLNFLEGRGLTMDVRQWFDHDVPEPHVPKNWVRTLLRKRKATDHLPLERRLVWLGDQPVVEGQPRHAKLTLPGRFADTAIRLPQTQGQWLQSIIRQATPHKNKKAPYPWLRDVQTGFPGSAEDFAALLASPGWRKARLAGLLLI